MLNVKLTKLGLVHCHIEVGGKDAALSSVSGSEVEVEDSILTLLSAIRLH